MKRKNLFALVLAVALPVCSCGWAENGMIQTVGGILEAYRQVIESYYNVCIVVPWRDLPRTVSKFSSEAGLFLFLRLLNFF